MSSAICFNLDQSKILLSGNGKDRSTSNSRKTNLQMLPDTPEKMQAFRYEKMSDRANLTLMLSLLNPLPHNAAF